MTQQEIVKHWQKGSRDAIATARWNYETEKYDLALFHCHLAVEKALKAAFIQNNDTEHPYTHELMRIALAIQPTWEQEDRDLFLHLSDFAIAARYSDPEWAAQQATKENASQWVTRAESFLEHFLPQP